MLTLTSPIETRAHRWPAGPKLMALCLLSIALYVFENPFFHIAVLALALLLSALPGRAFFMQNLRALWMLWPFILLLLIWHALTGLYAEGFGILIRMLGALAFANLMTMTTKLSDMMAFLERLMRPLSDRGIPTPRLDLAVALVLRFAPILILKADQLQMSWRARSRKRLSWRIIFPFTLMALDDAEHVGQALQARGGYLKTRERKEF